VIKFAILKIRRILVENLMSVVAYSLVQLFYLAYVFLCAFWSLLFIVL